MESKMRKSILYTVMSFFFLFWGRSSLAIESTETFCESIQNLNQDSNQYTNQKKYEPTQSELKSKFMHDSKWVLITGAGTYVSKYLANQIIPDAKAYLEQVAKFPPKNIMGQKHRISIRIVKWSSRTITTTSLLGASFFGYFLGEAVVDYDKLYLKGKIVTATGEYLEPIFKIIYDIGESFSLDSGKPDIQLNNGEVQICQ